MKTQLLGKDGEARAASFLTARGYQLLSAGYRSRYGEIDLIARKSDIVAFVEVKLRRDKRFALAAEAVHARKQDRIRATASLWMAETDCKLQARFDVIEVYTEDGRINHIENAFM